MGRDPGAIRGESPQRATRVARAAEMNGSVAAPYIAYGLPRPKCFELEERFSVRS